MKPLPVAAGLAAVLLTGAALPAFSADSVKVVLPEARASRAASPISIDGLLSEPVWQCEAAQARFIQSDPDQGSEPSYRTEVRVLYDDNALYVGARMFDTHPDSIVARLARRDESSRSDEFTVYFDPYHDKRSGYWFVISAAGTLRDGILYNDGWDDNSWDGVWVGKSKIDSLGWTAEMRIPLSQLRFKKSDQYRWGVNFRRYLARRNEYDMVAYTPRKESGFVSRFPDLVGITAVSPSRAIQITPYLTTRGEFLQRPPDDPFNDGSRYVPAMGADLKTALGSKLTLNAAVNPDFGQVEVDPAVVNLSDVETFFPEKRPFFVEGSSNYDFGTGGANNYWGFNWPGVTFFYSRRVGRAPQIFPGAADYADVPQGASILGAAKLTGKIAGDWNLGVMQAVTQREMADIVTGGVRGEAEVEPLTSYTVARTQKEMNNGRQGLGFLTTIAARDLGRPGFDNLLNRTSSAFGLDGWTFLDKDQMWVISGWTGMSHMTGTAARMTSVQRNPVHYLQRPDASRWRLDPDATSLTGYAGRLWLNKQKGSMIFNSGVGFINPLFDTNDLGFMSRADYANTHVVVGQKWTEPDKWKRYADIKGAVWGNVDFDGNLISPGVWLGGGIDFANYWSLWPRISFNPRSLNNRLTRGGPLTVSPQRYDGGFYFETDGRKPLFYSLDVGGARSQSGGWSLWFYPGVQWKPAPNVSVNVGPGLDRNHQNSQWVGSAADAGATQTYGRRYVFAQIDQTSLSASMRVNWAFTPNTSLQIYAQPLISSGNYFDFKSLARARSYEFEALGGGVPTYDTATDRVDLDGPGPGSPFNPDFRFTSLRGNAIMRWEYMPGSTLFLVWTQDRSGSENSGEFEFGPSFGRLVDQEPNNIFLAKVTYYLNL